MCAVIIVAATLSFSEVSCWVYLEWAAGLEGGRPRSVRVGADGLRAAADESVDVAADELLDGVLGVDVLQIGIEAVLLPQLGLVGQPDRRVAGDVLAGRQVGRRRGGRLTRRRRGAGGW